jgi:neutral ceramidase
MKMNAAIQALKLKAALILVCSAGAAVQAAEVPQSTLRVSRAEVDLTPPQPLPLGGYIARLEHVFQPGGQPLFARCVVLQSADTRIALVSAELLTIPESLYAAVQSRLPKDVHLFLAATHTHHAPDSQMLNERMTLPIPGIARFERRWLDWYVDRLASVVEAALAAEATTTSEMWMSHGPTTANRGRRPDAVVDSLAAFVRVPRQDPLFMTFAAHPVIKSVKDLRTHGDWPGAVMRDNLAYLAFTGPIGDMSPAVDGPDDEERIERLVEMLRRASTRFLDVVWKGEQPLAVASSTIDLAQPISHPAFADQHKLPAFLAQTFVSSFAPKSAQALALRIGSLAVVGVSAEPTAALGLRIREEGRKLGFEHVLVVSHVNGWMGYVLEPEDYDRGGYEASLAFHGREAGNRLVDGAVDALKQLRAEAIARR